MSQTRLADDSAVSASSVARGASSIVAGLAVLGAAGYAFLTITAKMVTPAEYATLASLYLLIVVFGAGLFASVDLEISRLVSRGLAQGQPTGTAVRQLRLIAVGLLATVLVVLAATANPLSTRVFDGNHWLVLGLALACAGYAFMSLPRGTFAGRSQLRRYAGTIGGEGLGRLLPCLGLALAGVHLASAYGIGVGLGPLLAAVACLPWVRLGPTGGHVPWRSLFAAVGWLAASNLLSLGMANLGPVVVKALLTGDPGRAGVFAFAFVLARIPQFLFTSAQTVLLPVLSRAAATGDHPLLRQGVRQAAYLVSALGALGVLGTAALGGFVLRMVFGDPHGIGALDLALLAVSAVFGMGIAVLQSALLALARHRAVTAAYAVGMVSFLVCFLLPVEPVAAGLTAQLVSAVVTVGFMYAVFRRAAAD
ncbi:MAG: lipopolysaccharide biosynthesis protein [Hamadaea sp.]|uniref:lipopolysaccharide biosynthesis protein n=1 Tax=Hamadaea sp. TaxID=2024425 RepID=UPI001807EE1A|nr:lipopolysaccharide biosynthesis protein [Hamadaea sp.]NUR74524.1 lipopolysaccharide biosynthesis protein [Hamadaea sp.]NUT18320.1 lipopolysaccharide biosynthesis protein [Hamadaea sp.]